MLETLSFDFTSESGENYKGIFEVKTKLTRAERFQADQMRRQILGPSPEGTPPLPALQTEAFILGQLAAHVVKAPKWWTDTGNNGLDLDESSVIFALYDKVLESISKENKALKDEADKTLKKLKKKPEEE